MTFNLSAKLAMLGSSLLFGACLAPVLAHADTMGLQVNGPCNAGSCPPSGLAFSSSASLPFSSNVTLADGDQFRIVGTLLQSSGINSISWNQPFFVQYLGGPNGVSQADSLSIATLFGFQSNPGVTIPTVGSDTGVFSSGLGAGSLVGISVSVDGNLVASLGTFTSSFSVSNIPETFTPAGTSFVLNEQFGVAFGAGSAPGSFMDFNGAPAPTPLPAALPLFAAGLGALGLLSRRRPRKTRSILPA